MIFDFVITWVAHITCNLGWDGLIKIAGVIGFIDAFLSLAITQSFSRKAFIRWRPALLVSLFLLWFAIICILVDIYAGFFDPGWPYYISTFGVLLWILGVIYLLYTFQKIFRIDELCFRITCCLREDEKFKKFPTCFSKDPLAPVCIDEEISRISAGNDTKKREIPRYPVVLSADENWRPWEVAADMAVNALAEDAGVIWFWFARPSPLGIPELKIEARLENNVKPEEIPRIKDNIVHIDCFDPGKNLTRNAHKQCKCTRCKTLTIVGTAWEWIRMHLPGHKGDFPSDNVLYADPRNPDEIDREYARAVHHLFHERGCTRLCVVYDPVTDFLYFTDVEVASRYLRVTMAWEQMKNIHSLYILRPGVLDPMLEQYILWYASTVISLKNEKGKASMEIRGMDRTPISRRVDYSLHCRKPPPSPEGPPAQGDPAVTADPKP
jgi:hypothetical protein